MGGQAERAVQALRDQVGATSLEDLERLRAERGAELEAVDARRGELQSELRVIDHLITIKVLELAEVLAEDGPAAELDDSDDPSGRQRQILVLLDRAGRPMSPSEVHDEMERAGENGLRLSALQNLMGRMAKRGHLERVDGARGRYVPKGSDVR